jgi:hydrogenase nickel incorporation protein HypA/HybF
MHELSIALSILDLASEEAERHGGSSIVAIHLRLGPLSGVAKDALRSAYELAREDSPCSAAELVIEEVPLVTFCPNCNAERMLTSAQEMCCPECGAATPTIVHGQELEVISLELES